MIDAYMSKLCANTPVVQRLRANNRRVVGYETTSYGKDIGRPGDYEQANINFPAMESHLLQRYVDRKAVGTGF